MGRMGNRFLTAAQRHGQAIGAAGRDYRRGYTREELKAMEELKAKMEHEETPIKVEKVVCNRCGIEYTDQDSLATVKKWAAEGYAPCPNISCPGMLEVKEA